MLASAPVGAAVRATLLLPRVLADRRSRDDARVTLAPVLVRAVLAKPLAAGRIAALAGSLELRRAGAAKVCWVVLWLVLSCVPRDLGQHLFRQHELPQQHIHWRSSKKREVERQVEVSLLRARYGKIILLNSKTLAHRGGSEGKDRDSTRGSAMACSIGATYATIWGRSTTERSVTITHQRPGHHTSARSDKRAR